MKEQPIETIPTDRPILAKVKCGGWVEVEYVEKKYWDNQAFEFPIPTEDITAWAELPENKDES